MSERQASWDPKDFASRGIPSTNLVNVYKRWGEGEYGQILTGNVMIEYDHLEAMGNPIIPLDAPTEGLRFERFAAMAKAGKAHGSLMVAQVSHPGRQVENRVQPNPISASDVQLEGLSNFLLRRAFPFPAEFMLTKMTHRNSNWTLLQ